MTAYPPQIRSIHCFVSGWSLSFACLAFALAVLSEETATAQNRDPQVVFEYAEQLEQRGVDTHFGPSVIDRVFEPFK